MPYARRGSRWHKDCVTDVCLPRRCSTLFLLNYSSSTREKFNEDVDTLVDLAHLQEQPSKFGPETALKCARRAV